MNRLFFDARSFNGDVSKWDVSRVKDMYGMFWNSKSFNCIISHWDVSRVSNMNFMFMDAASFQQKLCGAAWVHSKARKMRMFAGSSGSISRIACSLTDRELIKVISSPIPVPNNTMEIASACPKCGMFKKSGRASCCAPGGAWYKKCGKIRHNGVQHQWIDGVNVCKRKYY